MKNILSPNWFNSIIDFYQLTMFVAKQISPSLYYSGYILLYIYNMIAIIRVPWRIYTLNIGKGSHAWWKMHDNFFFLCCCCCWCLLASPLILLSLLFHHFGIIIFILYTSITFMYDEQRVCVYMYLWFAICDTLQHSNSHYHFTWLLIFIHFAIVSLLLSSLAVISTYDGMQ